MTYHETYPDPDRPPVVSPTRPNPRCSARYYVHPAHEWRNPDLSISSCAGTLHGSSQPPPPPPPPRVAPEDECDRDHPGFACVAECHEDASPPAHRAAPDGVTRCDVRDCALPGHAELPGLPVLEPTPDGTTIARLPLSAADPPLPPSEVVGYLPYLELSGEPRDTYPITIVGDLGAELTRGQALELADALRALVARLDESRARGGDRS
jgi:hypothetical protein